MKLHHSKLETKGQTEVPVCDDCGAEDTICHTGDVGFCHECYSVESYSYMFVGLDGDLYAENEINWDDAV